MKVSIGQLRQIIKEEISKIRVLREGVLALTAPEMSKVRPGPTRWEIFYSKMKSGSEFELVDGRAATLPLAVNRALAAAVKNASAVEYTAAFKVGVTAVDSATGEEFLLMSPKELKKTREFGGRGAGSGTAAEKGLIAEINAQIDAAKGEYDSIDIVVGGKTFTDVAKCVKVEGTPKADAVFKDSLGEDIGFFSLKSARRPSGINQWGGVSAISGHPEVVAFVKAVEEWFENNPGEIPSGVAIVSSVPLSAELAIKATYGPASGAKNGSLDNCDAIIASGPGGISLTAEKDSEATYRLAADFIWSGGTVPSGDWEPRLTARRGDRNNLGLYRTRVGIFPVGYRTGGRRIFVDPKQAAASPEVGTASTKKKKTK
jgi:hypothetical protein